MNNLIQLSQIVKGQNYIIKKIENNDHTIQLMEMGFVVGKRIEIQHTAPLGDPIAVLVAGYTLSIRKNDAALIWVAEI